MVILNDILNRNKNGKLKTIILGVYYEINFKRKKINIEYYYKGKKYDKKGDISYSKIFIYGFIASTDYT